jgi:hypothetical protein
MGAWTTAAIGIPQIEVNPILLVSPINEQSFFAPIDIASGLLYDNIENVSNF